MSIHSEQVRLSLCVDRLCFSKLVRYYHSVIGNALGCLRDEEDCLFAFSCHRCIDGSCIVHIPCIDLFRWVCTRMKAGSGGWTMRTLRSGSTSVSLDEEYLGGGASIVVGGPSPTSTKGLSAILADPYGGRCGSAACCLRRARMARALVALDLWADPEAVARRIRCNGRGQVVEDDGSRTPVATPSTTEDKRVRSFQGRQGFITA